MAAGAVILLSLITVVAAAVSLVVGLFLVTDSLVFVLVAVALSAMSLVLLGIGALRTRRTADDDPRPADD